MQVVCAINSSVGAFLDVVRRNRVLPAPSRGADIVPRWTPPTQLFTKINVDASWSASTCTGFVGVVLRDDDSSFVATIRHATRAQSTGVAEAMTISY